MAYRSNQLTVDLAQIQRNAEWLCGRLSPGAQLIAVVKADAYGHGAVPCARAALRGGADRLAVAIPEEALALRDAGITAPVLVLGPPATPSFAECVAREIALTYYDEPTLLAMHQAGLRAGKPLRIHLKLDTGMARLGVRDPAEAAHLARLARTLSGVCPEGIFTHLANADAPGDTYSAEQMQRWQQFLSGIDTSGLLCHAGNSAAALRYPQHHLQAVRCGIALYGCPSEETGQALRPAQRWTCRATQIKTLPADEAVSYGGIYRTGRESRIMTLPVGYADGYRRALTGRAQVLVRGQRAPVIGRICMDLCMADVTDIPDAREGDEVTLLGAQGNEHITPQEMAGWLDTIPYEVMLMPSDRVPRVYINTILR